MECFNGRPLTDAVKAKLWRLSRADAAANVKEKGGYELSKIGSFVCHSDRVEEWSGSGRRDIDGRATRPSEREANESISSYSVFTKKIVRDVSAALDPPQDGFAGANMTKITVVCR
jgi:hypothetical protein